MAAEGNRRPATGAPARGTHPSASRPGPVPTHRPRRPRAPLGRVVLLLGLLLPWFGAGEVAAHEEAGPLVALGDPIAEVAPAGDAALYARGEQGLYRSDDGGEVWTVVGPPPPPGRLVAGAEGGLLLAGERPPCARGGDSPPLHRSGDGAASWQEVAGAAGVLPLAVWADPDMAFGADCAGLAVSLDAGQSWTTTAIDPGREITAFTAVPPAGGTAATGQALVALTGEGGTSLLRPLDLSDPTAPAVGEALREFWGIGALAAGGGRIVLGQATGVWVSDDGGATWTGGRTGLEDVTISVDPNLAPIPDEELARGFGIAAVAIDPGNPDRLFAGTVGGLFASDDGGQSWSPAGGVMDAVTDLDLVPWAAQLFVETEAGVIAVPV